jgi:BirA family biotin operon repressor/biotin-[acetyl-CoA-carboxylase] ligase
VNPDLITQYLQTKTIGHQFYFFDSIDSTNNECRKRSSEREGIVVLSEQQTAGRGRLGRQWVSPAGKGIWMSILLKPDLAPNIVPQLTLVASAAVSEALERDKALQHQIKIKWPNDIVIGEKKVAGILTEMQISGEKIQSVILGIGINVNLQACDFPKVLWDQATSLYLETGVCWEREAIIAGVLNALERYYLDFLQDGQLGRALTIVRRKSAVIGRRVFLQGKGEGQEAEVLDLGPQGELMVRYDNGEYAPIISGEISLRVRQE